MTIEGYQLSRVSKREFPELFKTCSWAKVAFFFFSLALTFTILFVFFPIDPIVDDFFDGKNWTRNHYDFVQCEDDEECCNGLNSTCDMKLNELMFATMHHANHNENPGRHHILSLENAIEAGYRALHLGVCICDLGGEEGMGLVFCHSLCKIGRRDPVEVLNNVVSFLQENPTELIIIKFELFTGEPTVDEIWKIMKTIDGLEDRVYSHNGTDIKWPSVGSLLSQGIQIVAFQENGVSTEHIYNYENYAMETVDDFIDVNSIQNHHCNIASGKDNIRNFFALNHYVKGIFGRDQVSAMEINQEEFLLKRISDCETETGFNVNFVFVDFWHYGNLPKVTQIINTMRSNAK